MSSSDLIKFIQSNTWHIYTDYFKTQSTEIYNSSIHIHPKSVPWFFLQPFKIHKTRYKYIDTVMFTLFTYTKHIPCHQW